jgi:hypothetical protein
LNFFSARNYLPAWSYEAADDFSQIASDAFSAYSERAR